MSVARAFAAGLLVVALAAGCSDDDGQAADTVPATGSTAAGSEPSFGGRDSEGFCAHASELARAEGITESLFPNSGRNGDALAAEFRRYDEAARAAAEVAPEEIEEDVQRVAGAMRQLADVLAPYGFDLGRFVAEAQRDQSAVDAFRRVTDDADFAASASRVGAYLRQVCGVGD